MVQARERWTLTVVIVERQNSTSTKDCHGLSQTRHHKRVAELQRLPLVHPTLTTLQLSLQLPLQEHQLYAMSSAIQPSDVAVSYVDESLQQRDSVLVDGCDGESDECSGDDDDEHNEYGNGSQVGVETDGLIDKRPLFTALTLAGDNENTLFPRKGSSGGGGGKSSGGKTKGKVGTGIWDKSRGRPKVTKKKDKADGTGKEDVNLSNCIKDLPIVLSTCYINGDEGTIYADRMVESIYTLANATNRWDRGWRLENVTDIMEEITEAGCNLEPKCRDHMNRWIHYFRNPTDMPE